MHTSAREHKCSYSTVAVVITNIVIDSCLFCVCASYHYSGDGGGSDGADNSDCVAHIIIVDIIV